MSVPQSESTRASALAWYLAVSTMAGLGLIGKAPLLAKLGHLPLPVALSMAMSLPFVPLLYRLAWWRRRVVGVLVTIGLMTIFFTVLRTGLLHKLGRGSDQGDCVVVAAQQMAHAKWPYVAAEMPTKNAMSCGPAWVALQVPAIYLGGYFVDQVLLWVLALAVLLYCLSRDELAGFIALMGLSAGTWLSAADGNDFLPFGLLLAMVYVVVQSRSRAEVSTWALSGVLVILFCLAQFRVPTIFLPLFFLHSLGRRLALTTFAAAVLCQLAFLLWDTERFVTQGPMHVGMKLLRTGLGQGRLLVSAEFLIPVLVGGACVFWMVSRTQRVALLVLIYLGVLFALPAIQNFVLQYEHKRSILTAFGYWEGGNWIVGLLPLAALQLALVLGRGMKDAAKHREQPIDHTRAGTSTRFAL